MFWPSSHWFVLVWKCVWNSYFSECQKPTEKLNNSASLVFDAEHLCLSYQAMMPARWLQITSTPPRDQIHSKSVTDMIYAMTSGYSQEYFQPAIDRKIRIFRKKNQYTYKKECSLDRWRERKGVTGVTWSVLTMLDQMEAIFVLKHLYVREILEIFVKMYWKKPSVRKKIVSFWLQRKRKILTAKSIMAVALAWATKTEVFSRLLLYWSACMFERFWRYLLKCIGKH